MNNDQKLKFIRFVPSFLLLLIVGPEILSQDVIQQKEKLLRKIQRLEHQWQQISQRERDLSRELEQYSQHIARLKEKGDLNFLERRRLTDWLQKSQALAVELDSCSQRRQTLLKHLKATADSLIYLCQRELRILYDQLKSESLDKKRQKTLVEQLMRVYQEKEAYQRKWLPERSRVIQLIPVSVNPGDDSHRIREKADLVRDQEEQLRIQIEVLRRDRQRIKELLEIWQRSRDLMADFRLFDSRDEVFTGRRGVSSTGGAVPTGEEPSETRVFAEDLAADYRPSSLTTPAKTMLTGIERIPILRFSLEELWRMAPENLENALAALDRQQKLLEAKADSLRQVAETFYRLATPVKPPNR